MVLLRGCRGCFVSVLCVTSAPSDRVRPRGKKTRQAAQHVSLFALLSGILRGPSRRLRTLPHRNLFCAAS